MKDNKKIKSFNEHQEKLGISNVIKRLSTEQKETYIKNLKAEMNKYYKMDNFLLDDDDILKDKVKFLEKMIIGILNVL